VVRSRVRLERDPGPVGGYVLGNVLTSVVTIIGNYIVLLALHVPYALALSILVGTPVPQRLETVRVVRRHPAGRRSARRRK